jgi:4-aminobutyrate aminotransferase-like enzyme
MSVGGVILHIPSYLKRCAKATIHDAGGLYIADEVQTGFV